MLSVQTAGCAGMERLGVPARTSLNTPPDDRGQFSRRMRVEALQARELLAVRSSGSAETVIRSNNNHSGCTSNHHHQHHHHHQRMLSAAASNTSGCTLLGSNSINSNGGNTKSTTTINNSNIARGGIEATTLKYGNTGSGSGNSSSGSSCGSAVSSLDSHSHDHHQHYQQGLQQQQTLRCPHHVPLPDSEWGQDRDLQIRTRYQQSEITRSYIKPPPNKTIKDVPEQSSYNFYALTAQQAMPATLSQLHYANQHHLHHQQQQQQQHQQHHNSSYNQQHSTSSSTLTAASTSMLTTATVGAAAACSTSNSSKSKPNVITKLFSRKSSPKSPTALTTSSTCSSLASSASLTSMPSAASSASSLGSSSSASASVSTSSSASSLSSAQSLPISTAAALTTTACNYGASNATPSPPFLSGNNIIAGLAPTTQLLTTIGAPNTTATATTGRSTPPQTLVRIPTPPLSVCVPISYQQQQYNKQFQQQQQQLLLDSIVAESATSTASLQSLKSSSCSLSTSPLGAATSKTDVVSMDCCPQATTPRRQQSPSDTMRSANETQATTGNIRRNSSNCSMNSCNSCGCINGAECNSCNNLTTRTSRQQQKQQDDQQHAL